MRNIFSSQVSFKNDSLILKWKIATNENLIFNLFYKHENDENWWDVVLKNVHKNDNSSEYRVEYSFPNARPGTYTCQIQSACDFGVSEKSVKMFAYKEEKVSSITFFSATQKQVHNLAKHLYAAF